MNSRPLICIAALFASACTFSPQQDSLNGQFNPPLFYEKWNSNHYTTRNGMEVCAVSSGYNGITVTLGKAQGGVDVVVASDRQMKPGTEFTVTADGRSFVAYDTYFSPDQGRILVEYLSKGEKAYLDWSESNGPTGGQRVHVQNVLKLEDFRAKLKQCHDALGG